MKDSSKYNIESHKDGRRVTHRWVMRMLSAEHTTHCQSQRFGIIAIRPCADGIRIDFYKGDDSPRHHHEASLILGGDSAKPQWEGITRACNKLAAIKWILERINGGIDAGFTANDSVTVWRNQADREAVVLAVIGDQVLVEYEMPKGTSAMLLFNSIEGEFFDCGRSISYKTCPQKWVNAINAADMEWMGNSQTGYVAFPE